ncbi:MAG: thymidylate synthase [Armatimonadota bacterium]
MTDAFDLPLVCIAADSLAEGWERAVIACWQQGVAIPTQYDREGDPPSRDVSLALAIRNPFNEPRIHRALPGGIHDLEVYRQEVVLGIHDHWIAPEEGKWQYTYHERLTAYSLPDGRVVNQLDYVVDALAAAPHTRRAQAVIWKCWEDAGIDDPACLQRMWFRVYGDRLVMACHMRSNDAFKASYMNMYGFTDLQREIARRLSARLGRQIGVGQYNHVVDSYHIYGSYFGEVERFLQTVQARSFQERTWTMAQVEPLIAEAREKIDKHLERERERMGSDRT